jgi:N-acetylmuramoyl-L-alanine amidase
MDASQVRYIVVHCSASKPTQKVDAAVIDRWHRQRGFRKIGYHYVINRDGVVELGRMLDEAGAHAYGFNDCSVGICLVGGINAAGKAENNFTPAQFEELKAKLEELLVKFPKAQIVGHRDLPGVKKDCPSFDVRTWWAQENQA